MEHDKKYSAKEAALAVLKKAEEVIQKSQLLKQQADLAKSESDGPVHNPKRSNSAWDIHDYKGHEIHINKVPHSKRSGSAHEMHIKRPGAKYLTDHHVGGGFNSSEAALKHAKYRIDEGMDKPSHFSKSEKDVTPPDHVEKQPAPAENFNGNPAHGAVPQNYTEPYKGHIKLAKFLGRVEAKRGGKKAV
jgi:hypothetical protein